MKKQFSGVHFLFRTLIILASTSIPYTGAMAQQAISLNDLSAFKQPAKSWQIAGNVMADAGQDNILKIQKGQGILVNLPGKKEHGADLYTNDAFADVDLELDYMMAKGSNSGIYLQGRYELQLLDSWASGRATPGDNGGIYERWDEARGKGNEGFDGHAPRQNVSRAPGLWQHLKVVFQAPRFDANGRKTENAKFIRVELNGVVIHDNVELAGPTRGSAGAEAVKGPLRFQGDHGAVAFRNIRLKSYDQPRPQLANLKYKVYDGRYQDMPSFDTMKAIGAGTTNLLTSSVSKKDNNFFIQYTGDVIIKAAGDYTFDLYSAGGTGAIKVGNDWVRQFNSSESKPIKLQPGTYPIEVDYSKFLSWERSALGLSVSSGDIREFLISDPAAVVEETVDPIIVTAENNTIMRSFMDIPGRIRVVHAVSVGSPKHLHYTYDLDHGMLLQAWRGGFLDATPMWHDRGDGSSRPLGSKIVFGEPSFDIQQLKDAQQAWSNDTSGMNFAIKGYEVDDNNNPTFIYKLGGATIHDAFMVSENGQGLQRTIRVENNPSGFYARVAAADKIEEASNGVYLIDDKQYYVRIEKGGAKPVIRTANGKSELLVPVQSDLTYSILF